jgi:hypothetical protein
MDEKIVMAGLTLWHVSGCLTEFATGHCRTWSGNPCKRRARMDHRVKPGGDENMLSPAHEQDSDRTSRPFVETRIGSPRVKRQSAKAKQWRLLRRLDAL